MAFKIQNIAVAHKRIVELESQLSKLDPDFRTSRGGPIYHIRAANDEIARLETIVAAKSARAGLSAAVSPDLDRTKKSDIAAAKSLVRDDSFRAKRGCDIGRGAATNVRTPAPSPPPLAAQPATFERTHREIRTYRGDIKTAIESARKRLVEYGIDPDRVSAGQTSDFAKLRYLAGTGDEAFRVGQAKAADAAAKQKAFHPSGGLSLSDLAILNQDFFGDTAKIEAGYPVPTERHTRYLQNFAANGLSVIGQPRGLSVEGIPTDFLNTKRLAVGQEIIDIYTDCCLNGGPTVAQRNSSGARLWTKTH